MKRKVLVTVAVQIPGEPFFTTRSKWSTTTLDDQDPNFDRIIGDTAQLLGQQALLGHLRPTAQREGGRA